MFRSGSTTENLDLTNITPFSPALCLGLIDNISNLLLHHFLLMAKHYICSCKLRNSFPMLHAAFDDNNLASFKNKWATFKQIPGMQPSCVKQSCFVSDTCQPDWDLYSLSCSVLTWTGKRFFHYYVLLNLIILFNFIWL